MQKQGKEVVSNPLIEEFCQKYDLDGIVKDRSNKVYGEWDKIYKKRGINLNEIEDYKNVAASILFTLVEMETFYKNNYFIKFFESKVRFQPIQNRARDIQVEIGEKFSKEWSYKNK